MNLITGSWCCSAGREPPRRLPALDERRDQEDSRGPQQDDAADQPGLVRDEPPPFDHRVDRFEEAFTIIRTLLQHGAIDFDGRYYQARDCEILPRGPRPTGPPLMIGSNGPRMLRIAAPHVQAWNSWFADIGNRPDGIAPLRDVVDKACDAVGRDPAAIERTVAVLVRFPGGTGRVQGSYAEDPPPPLEGTPEVLAETLRAFAREGIGHVQLVIDPITRESIEAFAPVLRLLDG